MNKKQFKGEPFCGQAFGFHEYSDDVGKEDDTCIYCGLTKHEIKQAGPNGKSLASLPNS